jgi:hypothetical protein
MSPAESLYFAQFHPSQKKALEGTGRAAALPPVSQPSFFTSAKKGDQPSAGLIVEPEAHSREIEVLAWNTGVSIGVKDAFGEYETNVSHAEHQFVVWFLNRPKSWRDRVTSIELTVQSSSKKVTKICDKCTIDINEIENAHPGIVHRTFLAVGQTYPKDEKMEVKD